MAEHYADIHQSFHRCLSKRDFLHDFYTRFTRRHPDIAARFRDTDWDRQTYLLRHGISASILFADDSPLGEDEVERLRASHGTGGYAIPGWMYDEWLEALIDTLAATDPKWSAQLELRWREAMGRAIAHMRED